jgi:hypothetical protein
VARDLYAVLGVAPGADARAIGLAYRRLCRRYHPDVSREPGAEQRIREINAAYEVLGNPRQRLAYDRARAVTVPPVDAWSAAYRAWRETRRTPSSASEAQLRTVPGALDFGYIGRHEIAVRQIVVRGRNQRTFVARVLTRGDWLRVRTSELRGPEALLEVEADPRELHAFWNGAGPAEARVDGWLELVDATGSLRVPAGAILRRDAAREAWWNPFARRVG